MVQPGVPLFCIKPLCFPREGDKRYKSNKCLTSARVRIVQKISMREGVRWKAGMTNLQYLQYIHDRSLAEIGCWWLPIMKPSRTVWHLVISQCFLGCLEFGISSSDRNALSISRFRASNWIHNHKVPKIYQWPLGEPRTCVKYLTCFLFRSNFGNHDIFFLWTFSTSKDKTKIITDLCTDRALLSSHILEGDV